LWAKLWLRKKQYDATFLMFRFAHGFVFNGRPISEEEKKLVHHTIINAANFHMLSKEDQAIVLESAAQQPGL